MCCFGISMKCTGASGWMSWKASTSSSSYTFSARDLARARSCRRCSSASVAGIDVALLRGSGLRGRGRPSRRWPGLPSRRASSASTSAGPRPCRASSTRQWNHRSAISATMREFITVLRGHDRLGRFLADLLQDRVVALGEERRDVGRRRVGAAARRDRRGERARGRRRRRRQPSP